MKPIRKNEAHGIIPPENAGAGAVETLKRRYDIITQAAREVLKPGVDFGKPPGTGGKPTLLKPGAEKLAALFGLRVTYTLEDQYMDWENGVFYFRYKCRLLAPDGAVAGEGEGSANSRETKYRYRLVPEWEADEDTKARAVAVVEKRGRGGRRYRVYRVPNPEPFDLVNTLQKMAQKRALVAAVLNVTAASEFFTQDLEDDLLEEGATSPSDEQSKEGQVGPTEFWARAYALGIPRERALEIAQAADGDWAAALEVLGQAAEAEPESD